MPMIIGLFSCVLYGFKRDVVQCQKRPSTVSGMPMIIGLFSCVLGLF